MKWNDCIAYFTTHTHTHMLTRARAYGDLISFGSPSSFSFSFYFAYFSLNINVLIVMLRSSLSLSLLQKCFLLFVFSSWNWDWESSVRTFTKWWSCVNGQICYYAHNGTLMLELGKRRLRKANFAKILPNVTEHYLSWNWFWCSFIHFWSHWAAKTGDCNDMAICFTNNVLNKFFGM